MGISATDGKFLIGGTDQILDRMRTIILLILITSDITTQGTAPIPAENDAMYSWHQGINVREHEGKT